MSNFNDPSVASAGDALKAGDPTDGRAAPVSETVLSIENVARMFNVWQLTLRYYEFHGLIKRRHRIGRIPVYGWADCDRLAFIIKCRRAGLALRDVAPIVAAVDHEDDVVIHKLGQETCKKLVACLEERRKVVNEALSELAHTHSLLSLKILGPQNIASPIGQLS